MMNTLGIDPGVNGALAVYDAANKRIAHIQAMPTMKISKGKGARNVVDLPRLLEVLRGFAYFYDPQITVLEAVGPRHGDGAVGSFTFGEGYGLLRAGIACIFCCRHEPIQPQTWKRHMMVGTLDGDIMKRADQFFPGQSELWRGPKGGFLDGIAEASMLALYGEWVLNNKIPQFAKATKR